MTAFLWASVGASIVLVVGALALVITPDEPERGERREPRL